MSMIPQLTAAAAQAARRGGGLRTLFVVAAVLLLFVPMALVALPVSLVLAMGHGTAGAALSVCGGSAPDVKNGEKVAGYGHDQLQVAATIITVGQQLGVPTQGQAVALMVGMGESGLRDLDHGDAVDNTTIGVFQQGAGYGDRAARLDVAQSAQAFYKRMLAVANWQVLEPTAVAHAVQINKDPEFYAPYFAPAEKVLAALTGASGPGACTPPADAVDAAKELVADIRSGKLVFLEQRYEQQVLDMAAGKAAPGCAIDGHVLQLIVVATKAFPQVGVSDLNRRCTGSVLGVGTVSAHWKGKAVDFYALDHRSLTGSDPLSLQLIHTLDPFAPHGSAIGQVNCRADAGDAVAGLGNITGQLTDTCDHLHVQVP